MTTLIVILLYALGYRGGYRDGKADFAWALNDWVAGVPKR